MRVLCIAGFTSYWGKQLPPNVLELETGPTCGGGEEHAIRCATGLAELGHDVEFYWYGKKGEWRGVPFYSLDDVLYPRIIAEKWDVVASWSSLRPLLYAQPGTLRVLQQQLNDLTLPGDWSRVDVAVSPSLDHARMMYGWGWRGKRAVVHNGLDIELYKRHARCTICGERDRSCARVGGSGAYRARVVCGWCFRNGDPARARFAPELADFTSWDQRPMDVGHWSSPDRGLHHLLRAWPSIKARVTNARLHVGYEIHRYLKIALAARNGLYAARAAEIQYLMRSLEGDPSVTFHGAIPRRQLAGIQKQCRVQCYPFDPISYTEGFGSALAQGIAAGCLAMTTPKDAFPSLYGNSCYWLSKSTADIDFYEYVGDEVVRALKGELPDQQKILADAAKNADRYTWDRAAKEFDAVCRGENWMEGPP